MKLIKKIRIIVSNKEKGFAISTTEFIIMFQLVVLLLYAQIDGNIMDAQYNYANHIKNQYLDVARLQGCLTEENKNDIQDKLKESGFIVEAIEVYDYKDETLTYDEDFRAVRKITDTIDDIPEIKLVIRGKFEKDRFWLYKLHDVSGHDTEVEFRVQGTTFTEYVERV